MPAKIKPPRLNLFQKLTACALVAVILLVFVGAFVRAMGAGLGCPDWPFCWGCWIPPTTVEQIDFDRLDIEKYRSKAEQLGQDPASITRDSLREMFNPVHAWIEYVNRLTSLPVGFFTLLVLVFSIGQWRQGRARVFFAALLAAVLVGLNAWLGMRVVLSGLAPGIITLHMALAILLICVLVYIFWRGTAKPTQLPIAESRRKILFTTIVFLFILTVAEGVLGSQVREITDELAKSHSGEARGLWIDELETQLVYLLHRSFAWVILAMAIFFIHIARRGLDGRPGFLAWFIFGLICAQMVLGIVLANVGILRSAQVLHIGLSAILVSVQFYWILASSKSVELPDKRAIS